MVYRPRLSHIQKLYNNPHILEDKILQWTDPLRRYRFIKKHGKKANILKRDWDNLIILDACRFDIFAENNTINGELTRVISEGSHSREFMEHYFLEEELSDTIYITCNPNAEMISENVFYKIKNYTQRKVSRMT